MRISKRNLAAIVLMLAANANAQSDLQTKPRGTQPGNQTTARGSIVKGRVVYEDSGQPAPGQRVQLVPIESLANRRGPTRIPTTISGPNGEFSLLNPGTGEYYVVAQPADAHGSSAETAPFPRETGDQATDAANLEQFKRDFPRITVSGESPIEIEVRVKNPHFGRITGRILDANGTVVAGATVRAMKTGPDGFGLTVTSDANGAYQLKGLTPGEYVISANPPSQTAAPGRPPAIEGVLGATFFPSTIDAHASPPVSVSPDSELGNIDITLIPRSLHRVTGMVRGEGDGHPVAGASVRLEKKDAAATEGNTQPAGVEAAMNTYLATSDQQGQWSIGNLPDGVYSISVRPSGRLGAKAERFVNKQQELTIGGSDVENLAIDVSPGGRVSGHVTLETGKTSTSSIAITIGVGSASTLVDANGNFEVAGISEGEFPLSVMIRPPNAFYAKSIEVNGRNLLREKLNIQGASETKEVQVTIAPASILTGRVLTQPGGAPVGQVNVMLIPVDPASGSAFARPNGSSNALGTFTVSGAPGEYFVVLWRRGEPLPARDAASLAGSSNAVRVTLAPGERKSMDLIK